ncbi:MAG: hypothetical protein WD403_14790, partial [Pirellulales bacterium]
RNAGQSKYLSSMKADFRAACSLASLHRSEPNGPAVHRTSSVRGGAFRLAGERWQCTAAAMRAIAPPEMLAPCEGGDPSEFEETGSIDDGRHAQTLSGVRQGVVFAGG